MSDAIVYIVVELVNALVNAFHGKFLSQRVSMRAQEISDNRQKRTVRKTRLGMLAKNRINLIQELKLSSCVVLTRIKNQQPKKLQRSSSKAVQDLGKVPSNDKGKAGVYDKAKRHNCEYFLLLPQLPHGFETR